MKAIVEAILEDDELRHAAEALVKAGAELVEPHLVRSISHSQLGRLLLDRLAKDLHRHGVR